MMVKESFTWFLMVQLDNTRSAGQRIIQCNHFNYYRLATSGKKSKFVPFDKFCVVNAMQRNALPSLYDNIYWQRHDVSISCSTQAWTNYSLTGRIIALSHQSNGSTHEMLFPCCSTVIGIQNRPSFGVGGIIIRVMLDVLPFLLYIRKFMSCLQLAYVQHPTQFVLVATLRLVMIVAIKCSGTLKEQSGWIPRRLLSGTMNNESKNF